jgi:hypothetical protein
MACVVQIYGSGLNCANGSSLGNYSTIDYPDGTTLVSVTTCGYPGLRPKINGVVGGVESTYHPSGITITRVGCDLDPNQKCDCLNGGCVPALTYNTPGKYANLAACESGCGKDSPCDGECVSAAEIAALQQAANALQSRLCK